MVSVDPSESRSPEKLSRTAAFFDLDNTVLQGSTIYYMARGLMARRIFTKRQLWDFAGRQFRWATSGRENPTDVAQIFADVQTMLSGRRVDDMMALGRAIFDERMRDKIYPETRAIIEKHLAAGDDVFLVTAAGQEMADFIAEELNLTGALGTRSEIVDGVYTGRMAGPPMHGQVKADTVATLAKDRGFALPDCYAYSDSANDLPMLELVGHPTAINPDDELAEHASKHDWPSMDRPRPAIRQPCSRVSTAPSAGLGSSRWAGFSLWQCLDFTAG